MSVILLGIDQKSIGMDLKPIKIEWPWPMFLQSVGQIIMILQAKFV